MSEELVLEKELKIANINDIKNQTYIKMKRDNGCIDDKTAEFLLDQYSDTSTKYKKIVSSLVEVFGKENFKSIKILNKDKTVKDETDDKEAINSMHPYASYILTFEDENGNDVVLDFPEIKSSKRAVAKVEKGGKYDQQYNKEIKKGNKNPKKPYERLGDIYRCSVIAKFKGQLYDFASKVRSIDGVKENKVVDRFVGDLTDEKIKENFLNNKKNRREYKTVSDFFGSLVEMQYKTPETANGDSLTHGLYEEYRELKEAGLSSKLFEIKKNRILNSILQINNESVLKDNNEYFKFLSVKLKDVYKNNGGKYLTEDQEKFFVDSIKRNAFKRKSSVFNLDRDIPKEFNGNETLVEAVKDLYLFDNYEAVYDRKVKTVPLNHSKRYKGKHCISRDVGRSA
jgi:hypothetical protein